MLNSRFEARMRKTRSLCGTTLRIAGCGGFTRYKARAQFQQAGFGTRVSFRDRSHRTP